MKFQEFFSSLHPAIKVLLIILFVLVSFYIVILCFVSWRLGSNRRKLNSETYAIQLYIIEERRILIDLHDYLKFTLKLENTENSQFVDDILGFSISKIKTSNYLEYNQTITNYRKYLFKLVESKKLLNDPQINDYIFLIEDITSLIRKKMVLFNSNCDAYMYWRNRKIVKWFFDLLHINKPVRIN